MQVKAPVETGLVDVEGISVLHDELPYPQQPRLRTWFIAKLGLNLIPDLGKLLVAAQFFAGDVGHHLFMGHAKTQVSALAILQAEHVVAHARPTAARFPNFTRIQSRQQEFLPDFVHLFANNAHDFVNGSLTEEQVGVDSCAQLTDVSGTEKELVTGDFGVCRCFAKRRNENF